MSVPLGTLPPQQCRCKVQINVDGILKSQDVNISNISYIEKLLRPLGRNIKIKSEMTEFYKLVTFQFKLMLQSMDTGVLLLN